MKKSEYEKILSWSKKIRAIKLMGGACEKCGDENIYHLVFHHIGEKESNINDIRIK